MIDWDNLPSILLVNKLGFTEEGTLRDYEFNQEKFVNLKLFSLLHRDFLELFQK